MVSSESDRGRSKEKGPQTFRLLERVHLDGTDVVAKVTATTASTCFTGAYVLCSFADEEEPEHHIDLALQNGRLGDDVRFGRPAETFSFRLVTEQAGQDHNVISVHPVGIDGQRVNMAEAAFRFKLPLPNPHR